MAIIKLELPGFDANGGPSYIGTGCFHRRECLSGKKYSEEFKGDWWRVNKKVEASARTLEETSKVLASCSYEQNTDGKRGLSLSLSLCVRYNYLPAKGKIKKEPVSYDCLIADGIEIWLSTRGYYHWIIHTMSRLAIRLLQS